MKKHRLLALAAALCLFVQLPAGCIVSYADDDDEDYITYDYNLSGASWKIDADGRALAEWGCSFSSQTYDVTLIYNGEKKVKTYSGRSGTTGGLATLDFSSDIAAFRYVGPYSFEVYGKKAEESTESESLNVTAEMITAWGGEPKEANLNGISAEESKVAAASANVKLIESQSAALTAAQKASQAVKATLAKYGEGNTLGKWVHFMDEDFDDWAFMLPDNSFASNMFIKWDDNVYYIGSDQFLTYEQVIPDGDDMIYLGSNGAGFVLPKDNVDYDAIIEANKKAGKTAASLQSGYDMKTWKEEILKGPSPEHNLNSVEALDVAAEFMKENPDYFKVLSGPEGDGTNFERDNPKVTMIGEFIHGERLD